MITANEDNNSVRLLDSGDPSYIPADGIVRFTGDEKCYRGSKMILIKQTTYYCNMEIVTEKWYKSLTDAQRTKQNCLSRELKNEWCLCPEDTKGKYCESETRVYCQLQILKEPTCPYLNDDSYVSDYSGLPPCVSISDEKILSYEVKAVCENMIEIPKEPSVFEANSDMVIILDEEPPSSEKPWTKFTNYNYVVNSTDLKITRQRDLTPQIQYINWNNMGSTVKDNYGQKFNLTNDQLLGKTPFTIFLNFKSLVVDVKTSGRYNIEFNVVEQIPANAELKNDAYLLSASPVKLIMFEDSSYNEPTQTLGTGVVAIIIIVLLIIVICILAVVIYFTRRKNLSQIYPSSLEQDNSLQEHLSVPYQQPGSGSNE